MNFQEYISVLSKNHIKLFDFEKRISFQNIKNYKFNYNQKGGGIINSKSKDELLNIINISLSSNPKNLISLLN